MMNMSLSADGSKVKKTRRRLRLSCVECTKRRQKCDRNHPCSLCTSRGVPHLCRWETVPIARPPPSRPPTSASRYMDGIAEHDAIVKQLTDRIASLEQALAGQQQQQRPQQPHPSGSRLPQPHRRSGSPILVKASPGSDLDTRAVLLSSTPPSVDLSYAQIDIASTIPFPLTEVLYKNTSTLAQLSLAHHGEFIGRGSLICALHSLSARTSPRFLYAKSTDATFDDRESMQRFSPLPYASHSVQELLMNLPEESTFDYLVESYFLVLNWRYGISRTWFDRASSQMWSKLQTSSLHSSEINANWLALVFAILTVAPRDDKMDPTIPVPRSPDDYFMCAMVARRIAEDDYFNTPRTSTMVSPADGTVLGCLAVPLLCSFLAERGRVSEAWKLVGNSLRNAQAVGLHRDPEWRLWQLMSEDEKFLRKRAWWGLFIADMCYSYILGRPPMIQRDTHDVTLPPSSNDAGVRDLFNVNQSLMVEFATLLRETMDTCYNMEYPRCRCFLEMDAKFERWASALPKEYQQSQDISLLPEYEHPQLSILAQQRYLLHTWYLIGRVKLQIAATTGQNRVAQVPADLARCRELCIRLAVEVVEFQCDFHDALLQQYPQHRVQDAYLATGWLFHGCISVFEACVALCATIARLPTQQKVPGVMEAIDRALRVFGEVVEREKGKKTGCIAHMAISVLAALREEHFGVSRLDAGQVENRLKDESSVMKSLFVKFPGVPSRVDRDSDDETRPEARMDYGYHDGGSSSKGGPARSRYGTG